MVIIYLYTPQAPRVKISRVHKAACHCKAVEFEVHLPHGLVDPRRCDCSFCRMRGAIAATAALDAIKILKGQDKLTLYQFNTMTAKHYFCSVCGIYTHHQRRSNPNEFGFNVACLEGVNPFDLGDIKVADGVHHPADH
ncbi:MAG: GFA family protein [Bdellovibrionales bacterium]